MALRNAFENLGLDSTLQAIRDRLPSALGGSGGVKVEQQGSLPSGTNVIGAVKIADSTGGNEATVNSNGTLKVDLSATAANATAVKVDGSAATQPVSGTVTANQGGIWDIRNVSGTVSLPTNAATSTKQSDGSQKTQIVDGSGNVIGSTGNALDINIKSGNPSTTAVTQATASNLNAQVVGNVASGATDSGNPVKAGGIYNLTKPTFTDGQRGDLQVGTRGSLSTSIYANDATTAQAFAADNADAVAVNATANKMAIINRNTVYNGTSWDRQPGSTTGAYNVIRDAAGNARGANVTAGNALSMDITSVAGGTAINSGVTGALAVGGDTASGATDAGNPVKVGGRFNSTQPTLTDGQRGDLQLGSKGALKVTLFQDASTNTTTFMQDNADAVAVSATFNKLAVQNRNTVYNGTSWDRQAGTTAGTYNILRDAAGNARGANVTAGNALVVDGSAATQPVSGTVTSTQAATASNIGAYSMTDAVFNGTTSLTPKFATIVASASGATTVVAAVGGKRIRVLQVVLIANAAVNVKFQSHVTPTDITGLFYLAGNSGFSSGFSSVGQFQTVSGEALDINLSGAIAVGGYLTYVEV